MNRLTKIAAAGAAVVASACGGRAFTSDGVEAGGAGGVGGSQSGGTSGSGGKGGSAGSGGKAGTGGGSFCGDGRCELPEYCASCPGDCGPCAVGGSGGGTSCGNGYCDFGETCTTCAGDCLCGVGGSAGAGCFDPDGLDPAEATTASGINGSFSDQCDGSGNLMEFVCETIFEENCLPNPDPSCRYQTGMVVESFVDCEGRCENGTCTGRCPHQGDTLTYLQVESTTGSAVLQNGVDGQTYSCNVIFDASTDTYNCITGPIAGTITKVYSLGLSTQFCVTSQLGNIGTAQAGTQQCTYSCTLNL